LVFDVFGDNQRLPGEQELLDHIKDHWYFGGTLAQIDATFDPLNRNSIPTFQLMELLLSYEDITEAGGLYYPVRK
jgi:hypothetical protein